MPYYARPTSILQNVGLAAGVLMMMGGLFASHIDILAAGSLLAAFGSKGYDVELKVVLWSLAIFTVGYSIIGGFAQILLR